MDLPDSLHAAIVAAPDEPAPYLVAGDHLASRGDPRGELVSVMRGLEHEDSPARFLAQKARRDELLRVYGEAWLGGAHLDEALWRWGFVSHARLQLEHLDTFLGSPAGRYVRELEIHGPLTELAAILSRARPAVLRGLYLVGGPRSRPFQLAKVLEAVPGLTRLQLAGVDADFSAAPAAGLTDLRLKDIAHPTLTPFLTSLDAPRLTALELLLDAPLELKAAVALRHPQVSRLRMEDDLADDLALWAARTLPVRSMDALALVGPMTDRGLDELLLASARLQRLRLAVEGGQFSAARKRLARRQLPALSFLRHRTVLPWWERPPTRR